MQVACPSCANVLTVPPEKAAVPNLKAKCRCGTVFAVTGAAASGSTAGTVATAAPRVAPAANERVAAIRAANAAAAAAGGEVLPRPPLPARPAGVPAGAPLRTAAAVPRPAPPLVPRPAPPNGAVAGTDSPRPRSAPVPWRRCQNHPQVRSEAVCPKCAKGYCDACTQKVQTAVICPACEGLCVASAAYEQGLEKAKQRDRTMMEEIGVIAAYPFADTLAFVLLALFTWFFGLFAGFAFIMVLLSKGVLTWYSFNSVSKVASGNLRDVMPEFREVSDISHALRLSAAALVISAGPLLACLFLIPGADMMLSARHAARHAAATTADLARAQAPAGVSEGDGERRSTFDADREGSSVIAPLAMLAIVLSAIWAFVYMPVALTVAALSKSILSTLNPMIGIDTIKKMGGTYWQALAIYGVLVVGQVVVTWVLRLIPLAGGLAASFVDAYAALAVGCTLGMAVFKKAVELGWD